MQEVYCNYFHLSKLNLEWLTKSNNTKCLIRGLWTRFIAHIKCFITPLTTINLDSRLYNLMKKVIDVLILVIAVSRLEAVPQCLILYGYIRGLWTVFMSPLMRIWIWIMRLLQTLSDVSNFYFASLEAKRRIGGYFINIWYDGAMAWGWICKDKCRIFIEA